MLDSFAFMFLSTFRFLIYASDVINLPSEASECWNNPNCYGVCGSIYQPEAIYSYASDIKIRQFRIKLSEIDSYVCPYMQHPKFNCQCFIS